MTESRVCRPGKLGFGLMRLPKKGFSIDIGETCEMVDRFLQAGFDYFDTALLYPGSEPAVKKALTDRIPRERYRLATKLNAMIAPTEKAAKQQLTTSLERTGAGYFDYYLLHALMDINWRRYEKFHLWEFLSEQKALGRVRKIGFSFHAGPELLDRLLTEHPEVDFVQLQINYADWESPSVCARENYEVARRHQKPVIVMEPVKGGRLADPPAKVRNLLKAAHPNWSYASWAIRFAASLDGVETVLSGMSTAAQMEDNLSYMWDFQPLTPEERAVLTEAQRLLGQEAGIPCTGCGYCISSCPKQIPIPELFAAANERLEHGREQTAREGYRTAVAGRGAAGDCVHCRKCEAICPQHLPVTRYLQQSRELCRGER